MDLSKIIKIKYHDPEMPKIEKIEKGDWIDLRASEDILLEKGEFKLINLGVSIKVPDGYEAHLKPRSSTFKNWGIIQTNSVGTIDESYASDQDIWKMPVYCTRDDKINKYDRVCQFKIVKKMPTLIFEEVDSLGNNERGGFGSSGIK